MATAARTLAEDRRGAVYVEFLVAFMPVFVTFLGIAQLADLYAARLVIEHAAVRTARAGAVVFPDDPRNYNAVSKSDEVLAAGHMVLSAKRNIESAEIELPRGSEYQRGEPVEVVIVAQVRCLFPLADRLLCSLNGRKQISARAQLPAHAAEYDYGE